MDPAVSEPIAKGTIPAVEKISVAGLFLLTFQDLHSGPFIAETRNNQCKDIPAEVEAAGPADEPVEYSSIFQGFLVLPPNQMSSYASDPVTSFARRTAPADFSLK